MTADVQRPTPPLTDEPVRRRHDGPCPECEGTDAILHGGRVLECRDCGWEWAYAGRSMGDVQAEIEQLSTPTPPLTEEELAEMYTKYSVAYGRRTLLCRLIADLRAARSELAALSWATREYDEDTGYCLCGCCRHGI